MSRGSPSRADVVRSLATEIRAVASATFTRVGVDGFDGAGKTFLADELADELRRLGSAVVRVSVDGFHNPSDVRHRRGRDDPEGFFSDSYAYDALRALVLEPFAAGGSGRYTPAIYDVAAERPVVAVPVQAAPGSILVVDGIFLHCDELAAYWDYSIWLDVPFEISIPRGAQRGFGDPDPAAASNRRYVEGQRLYVATCTPDRRATVVLENSVLESPVLRRRFVR